MNLEFTEKVISSLGVQQIIDISGQTPTNKLYTWPDLTGWRKLEDLTTIVLHHDAYPKKNRLSYTPIQQINDIAKDHIKLTTNEKTGDPGFPYHFYIIRGQAYLVNPIAFYTYGVASNNPYTIHVCVHGEYKNYDALTDDDLNCILAVCIMLKSNMTNFQAVKGHGEINPTQCPGYSMNRVRDSLITAEQHMIADDTWKFKVNKVNELAEEYNYLFERLSLGEEDGNAQWAMHNLLATRDIMIERGLLKIKKSAPS